MCIRDRVQVHEKIDLSFERVLRSALRQDPDIVLVGEMRDPVSYTHLRAHETVLDLVCRLLLANKTLSLHSTLLPLTHAAQCYDDSLRCSVTT